MPPIDYSIITPGTGPRPTSAQSAANPTNPNLHLRPTSTVPIDVRTGLPISSTNVVNTSGILSSVNGQTAIEKAQAYIAGQAPNLPSYQKGSTVDLGSGGQYVKNPDGTFTPVPIKEPSKAEPSKTEPPKTEPPTGAPEASTDPELEKYKKALQDNIDKANADAADFKSKSDALITQFDSANAALIKSIQDNYSQAIGKQTEINKAYMGSLEQSGARLGQARYAQESFAGQEKAEMTAGVDRILKLQSERDQLIAQAQIAQNKEQWDRYYKTYQELQDNRENATKAIQDLYNASEKFKENAAKQAQDKIANLKTAQELNQKTIDSLGSLASSILQGYADNNDVDGGVAALSDLAAQYGVDANMLVSKAQELANKEKSWSEVYTDPTTKQRLQRNLQTGEIRSVYNPPASSQTNDEPVDENVLKGMLNVYKSTGVMPPFGLSGKSPLRQQFFAALGSENGNQIVTDANTNKAVRAGLSFALRTQQNLQSANKTAIGTLEKQLQLVGQYSDQVSRSDSPLINKYLLGIKTGVFGDPQAAALNNIVKTAAYEFAKILSGSAASIAGVTVSSSADAEEMLNSAMSKGQFKEVLGLMKKEADFRLKSQQETIDQLQKDMNSINNPQPDGETNLDALRQKYKY